MITMQPQDLTQEAGDIQAVLSTIPTKSKEITALTGYKDITIRKAVRELRLKGVRVCSDKRGFWLWDGQSKDWAHTKAQIASRRNQLDLLYRAMTRQPLEGQIDMNGEEVRQL